ncbi:MAG: LuxR C-terminal-related transcriptional regulator [Candidatus Thiodiazotropha sp.]
MPFRDTNLTNYACIQGTAIFLVDLHVAKHLDMGGISKIFSLSNAEKNVAELLINGLSPNEIAESRNASIDTIRKQLKAVYAKTGIQSQLGLLRLASIANPPIEDKH